MYLSHHPPPDLDSVVRVWESNEPEAQIQSAANIIQVLDFFVVAK
jgi:hypothetical protein